MSVPNSAPLEHAQPHPAAYSGGYPGTPPPLYPGFIDPGYTGPGPRERTPGEHLAQQSMILGAVGLFAAGIILGPLAIYYAGKAEKLNAPATAGKVLGWLTTILNVTGMALFIYVSWVVLNFILYSEPNDVWGGGLAT